MRSDRLVILGNCKLLRLGGRLSPWHSHKFFPVCLAWEMRQEQVEKLRVKHEPLQETDSRVTNSSYSAPCSSRWLFLYSFIQQIFTERLTWVPTSSRPQAFAWAGSLPHPCTPTWYPSRPSRRSPPLGSRHPSLPDTLLLSPKEARSHRPG